MQELTDNRIMNLIQTAPEAWSRIDYFEADSLVRNNRITERAQKHIWESCRLYEQIFQLSGDALLTDSVLERTAGDI